MHLNITDFKILKAEFQFLFLNIDLNTAHQWSFEKE